MAKTNWGQIALIGAGGLLAFQLLKGKPQNGDGGGMFPPINFEGIFEGIEWPEWPEFDLPGGDVITENVTNIYNYFTGEEKTEWVPPKQRQIGSPWLAPNMPPIISYYGVEGKPVLSTRIYGPAKSDTKIVKEPDILEKGKQWYRDYTEQISDVIGDPGDFLSTMAKSNWGKLDRRFKKQFDVDLSGVWDSFTGDNPWDAVKEYGEEFMDKINVWEEPVDQLNEFVTKMEDALEVIKDPEQLIEKTVTAGGKAFFAGMREVGKGVGKSITREEKFDIESPGWLGAVSGVGTTATWLANRIGLLGSKVVPQEGLGLRWAARAGQAYLMASGPATQIELDWGIDIKGIGMGEAIRKQAGLDAIDRRRGEGGVFGWPEDLLEPMEYTEGLRWLADEMRPEGWGWDDLDKLKFWE